MHWAEVFFCLQCSSKPRTNNKIQTTVCCKCSICDHCVKEFKTLSECPFCKGKISDIYVKGSPFYECNEFAEKIQTERAEFFLTHYEIPKVSPVKLKISFKAQARKSANILKNGGKANKFPPPPKLQPPGSMQPDGLKDITAMLLKKIDEKIKQSDENKENDDVVPLLKSTIYKKSDSKPKGKKKVSRSRGRRVRSYSPRRRRGRSPPRRRRSRSPRRRSRR